MKLIITIVLCFIACANALYVTVPTGEAIVWYKWKVLQENVGEPGGIHFYNPFTTDYQLVDVTFQKDTMSPIKCVSRDKQLVIFPSIEVWNQLPYSDVYKVLKTFEKKEKGIPYDKSLIYDPVINYIKETCSDYTGEQLRSDNYKSLNEMLKTELETFQHNRPELNGGSTGLRILKVFVEIPKLSDAVEKNYQEIAIHKTATQAEGYRQQTELKKKETSNKLEELDADKTKTVASTKNKQEIEANEAKAKMAKITAESEAEQKRINADAQSYVNHKKANDNKELLTDAYLRMIQLESYGCQNVIHYGDLPHFLPGPILTSKYDKNT